MVIDVAQVISSIGVSGRPSSESAVARMRIAEGHAANIAQLDGFDMIRAGRGRSQW